MPETPDGFMPYAYAYSPSARQVREQFPKELLPRLLSIVDDLAADPDSLSQRAMKIGQGQIGELHLYRHPNPPLEIIYEIDRNSRRLYFIHFAAPVLQLKQVFMSYSHQDTEWLVRMRQLLEPLEKRGLLNIWVDTEIQVGTEWLVEIRKALESADVAVLLVTQDFLNSPFIQGEELTAVLAKAEREGLRVIWIAIKESSVGDSPLWKFQAANDPKRPLDSLPESEQKRILEDIRSKIEKAVSAN